MSDFDAAQPIRTTATESTVEVANAAGTTINPAEDYAQGSTTSGENGVLVQGAVTTSSPTYTTGQTNPLSLDTSGNLRVVVSAGASSAVTGASTVESTAAWTSATAGNTALTQTISGYNTVLVTLNQGTTITGGVVTFEVSDTTGFTNAYPVNAVELNGFVAGSTYTLTASTNQAFLVNVAAAAAFRVRLSTAISGSGTVNVGIQANGMATEPSVTVGGTVTSNQGTPNSLANGWPVEITDGTNILGTAAHPVRVDPTGTTTQPVSGTVAVTQSTSPWVENLTQVGGSAITLGQKTSANSVPVVIASDQSTINTNSAQVAGTTTSVNTGNADAGTQRVVLASNQPAIAVTTTPPTETAPDFKHASSIASAASDTHSFTPGSTINLDKITASASGEIKVEVQWGPTGSETSKWVGFTSASDKYVELWLPNPVSIPNTSTIKVIVTNEDTAAQDLYSSIIYH